MQPAFDSGMCEHVISFIGCSLESPEAAANAALCRRFIITLLDCGARRGVSSLSLGFADKKAWEGEARESPPAKSYACRVQVRWSVTDQTGFNSLMMSSRAEIWN